MAKSGPAAVITLDTPERIFANKTFACTYKDLENHQITVDMWKISNWTFNSHFGTRTMSLYELANGTSSRTDMIKKKLTKKEVPEAPGAQQRVLDFCSFVTQGIFGAEFWVQKALNTIKHKRKRPNDSELLTK